METDELRACVPEAEVAAAVCVLRGPRVKLLSWEVSPPTAVVQGFTSLILRITAIIVKEGSESSEERVTFIVKRLPLTQAQRDDIEENEMFDREVEFFQFGAPALRSRASCELPVVHCLGARPGFILLEDLGAQGFALAVRGMGDISNNVLSLTHLKLVMERLARLHAASLGTDWLHVMPSLTRDVWLENPPLPFPRIFKKACNAYAEAMNKFHPEVDKKYSDWLKSPEPLTSLLKLVKPSNSGDLVVLTHGDFWVNNIMFKLNPDTNEPVDVKFVDFQMCRYVPPSRDIQNLLYTCMDYNFRQQHEAALLSYYVDSFNATLGSPRLSLHELRTEYERSRLFGVCVALVFRTMNMMPDLYPGEGQEMSSEMYEALISGDHFDSMLKRCENKPNFENTVKELLQQIVSVLDEWGL